MFGKKDINPEYRLEGKNEDNKVSLKEALVSWGPFILIFILLLSTSKLIAPLNVLLATVKTTVQIYTGVNASPYTFSWLATPALWIYRMAP